MQRTASDVSDDDIGVDEPDEMEWCGTAHPPFPASSECARAEAQADAAVLMAGDGYVTERTPPRVRTRPPPPVVKPSPKPVHKKHTDVARPPRARPITTGMVSCVAAVFWTVWECVAGACELARIAVEAMRAALHIAPMYEPRTDAPESSAVRGALLLIVMAEVAALCIQAGMLVAVGTTGEYADVVHMQYAETQVVALAAVPLGVYVYVMGGVDPTSPGGAHVYTLYMVCELFKAIGDGVCAARLAAAFDDAHHVAAAIAPAHVIASSDPWDHGACGQPHAVRAAMIALAVLGAVLSGLNFVSLLGRDRAKAKASDDEASDPDPVVVPMKPTPPPTAPPKRRRQDARRMITAAPPPPPPPPATRSPSNQMLLDALVDFEE